MSENHEFIKAVSDGIAAGAINHYLSYGSEINSEYLKYSLMFSGVVGAGFLASSMVAPGLVAQHGGANSHWMSAKTLEHRVIEVGLGTGSVVLFNRYITMLTPQTMVKTAGIVFAADFIGEYVADYATSQPLSHFA